MTVHETTEYFLLKPSKAGRCSILEFRMFSARRLGEPLGRSSQWSLMV